MRREQLEHAIRASARILGVTEVIVVGSQSVLGTWDEYELPPRATLTNEADIMSTDTDNTRVMRQSDELEGAAGELSHFHHTHGFYLDGVDLTTSVLPHAWRDRLVPLRNARTNYTTGWCLDASDLCVAKLIAFREKDLEFVDALIEASLITPRLVGERLQTVAPEFAVPAHRAQSWLDARSTCR